MSPHLAGRLRPWDVHHRNVACAVIADLQDRHPWEAVGRHFDDVDMEELYFGFAYIVRGAHPRREE